MQRYTVYFICKLLYMFLVVPSPIIRSTKQLTTAYATHSTLKTVPTLPR